MASCVTSNLATANLNFSLCLLKHLSKDTENIFFSPISLSTVFGMIFLGSAGESQKQLEDIFSFGSFNSTEDVHKEMLEISKLFRGQNNIELNVANRILAQEKYTFLQDFIHSLKNFYEQDPIRVNFASSEKSKIVQDLNKWVEDITKGKIKNLLKEDAVTALTRMILVNAVYFKADWAEKFDERATQIMNFMITKDEKVETRMMYRSGKYRLGYSSNLNIQVLELPYKNPNFKMLVFLPLPHQQGGLFALNELQNKLNIDILSNMRGHFSYTEEKISVFFPKFRLETKLELEAVLPQLGLKDVFDEKLADLSLMTGTKDLFVSSAVHKAFLEVNEEGSEAAAATAAVMSLRCAAVNPEFRANRPFLFSIVHSSSGTPLFFGRYVRP
ncbi:unnamed protein product [Dimorphilus gyrociliatus]|uniref:Serpin domain-containing protein n=1 Tax=Dimorphilus gyrociliatus TaxID=2664684 RepID=A0A7I8VPJ9_9ANNE|nr:unnamed protein product [Dimorphilus gyrociliatus]